MNTRDTMNFTFGKVPETAGGDSDVCKVFSTVPGMVTGAGSREITSQLHTGSRGNWCKTTPLPPVKLHVLEFPQLPQTSVQIHEQGALKPPHLI